MKITKKTSIYLPCRAMWLPGPQANPAEFCFAVLVSAHHVVAATIFLYGDVAFRTFLQHNGKMAVIHLGHQMPEKKKNHHTK